MNDQKRPMRPKDMELFEVTPFILGGEPASPKSKTWLTRQQHFEAVRYWNRVISEPRKKQ